MSEPQDLYPPAQYGGGWFLLAIGVIMLGLIFAFVVLWITRPRYSLTTQVRGEVPDQIDPDAVTQALRGEYLYRLQLIQDAYVAGEIDPREANRRLSREVRGFVHDYNGFEAPVLGLNDLVTLGVPLPLIDALQRHYYPSIFSRGTPIDPIAGVEAGRLVVNSWH